MRHRLLRACRAICADEPETIVATRKDSPIVVGMGGDGAYVASDMIAMISATRDVVILGDREYAKLSPAEVEYFNDEGERLEPEVTHVDWDIDVVEKGGYPDFMLKEIHEQPRVIRDTLAGRMVNGALSIDELDLSTEELNLIDRVYVIACGTSYHAGLIAKNLIEGWARIPTEVEVASEFRYRNPIITPSTLVVAVSQSGETADTSAAIRDARVKGARVFGITNVVGSPVARESDGVIYTKANKEIAVASTKSFLPGGKPHASGAASGAGEGQACHQPGAPFIPRAGRHGRTGGRDPFRHRCHRRSGARVQGRNERAAHRARHGLCHLLRGRAQAQGDKLSACRGVPGGRDEARPHCAYRRRVSHRGRGDAKPGVRQGHFQPAGKQGARREDRGRGHARRCGDHRSTPTT